MVRLSDRLNMTIVVDWDVKPQIKQTNEEYFGNFPVLNVHNLTSHFH